jgi:hypothetical protein
MARTTLTVDIKYDPELTDPEGLASAMDRLLETALSTPGIMEEYGDPKVGEFFVADTSPDSAAACSLASPETEFAPRWVLYDQDQDRLLTTEVYRSYEEAANAASRFNDALVVPLVWQEIRL